MKQFQTILGQILKLCDRDRFQGIVNRYHGDKHVRKLTCWAQFVTNLYAQITGKISLRETVTGLQAHQEKHYHLGIEDEVKRSTLADANEKRNANIYRTYFFELLKQCRSFNRTHRFHFSNKVYLLDSTMITLCLSLFDWAKYSSRKAAIKLHTVLEAGSQLPTFINFTNGKVSDIRAARQMAFEKDSFIVFDLGYFCFAWMYALHCAHNFFVTRIKDGVCYRILEHNPLLPAHREYGIVADCIIQLTGQKAVKNIPIKLRLVRFRDPESGETYEFLTNKFDLSPITIAELYKHRWQIELFFKWIKQNLRIKTFIGTSENAVMTQIWTAMITYLIASYIQYLYKTEKDLLTIMRLIKEKLMFAMSLADLLNPKPRVDYRAARGLRKKFQLGFQI